MSALRSVSVRPNKGVYDRLVPTAAVRHEPSAERFDRPATGPGNVSIVSGFAVPAELADDWFVPGTAACLTEILSLPGLGRNHS